MPTSDQSIARDTDVMWPFLYIHVAVMNASEACKTVQGYVKLQLWQLCAYTFLRLSQKSRH